MVCLTTIMTQNKVTELIFPTEQASWLKTKSGRWEKGVESHGEEGSLNAECLL